MPSVLPNSLPKMGTPIGRVTETGEVIISKEWWLMFYQFWVYTVSGGFSTQDDIMVDSTRQDEGPVYSFNGITGSQTATFTASNKPGTGTTTPDTWIAVPINGVIHYIPAWK